MDAIATKTRFEPLIIAALDAEEDREESGVGDCEGAELLFGEGSDIGSSAYTCFVQVLKYYTQKVPAVECRIL